MVEKPAPIRYQLNHIELHLINASMSGNVTEGMPLVWEGEDIVTSPHVYLSFAENHGGKCHYKSHFVK